jgi:Spy/CpxP family protein refolding chaperone
VAALAVAALATGSWAAAQGSGNGAGNGAGSGAGNGADGAPATQQSQDQSPDRGGFDARRFDRDGPQRFRHARYHRYRDWQRHRDWDRWHGPARGRAGEFARARMRRGTALAAMRLDAPMLGAFRQLNLSDSQRQSVRTILVNARNSARQSARQERGNQAGAAGTAGDRRDLAALLNPADPDHARAVEAVKGRAVDRIQRAAQTQQALYNVLTPAQKTQLAQLFAQRRARMQQRGEQPPGLRG